jgi:asparagine synthase (glutamine-hydrolysing)
MCGITGVAAASDAAPVDAGCLHRMCETLLHRGPNEEGSGIADGVALGMRRLSIIDVEGGHQPLQNEDGSVRAVFNGEIYNFRELRQRLEEKGHRMGSRSDGEVIPHLWEEYGAEFPALLNGMYAIALHDRRQRRLLLVRDRIGVKPLFYARAGRRLVFGSEVKSLLASGLLDRELDLDALQQFLAWEYVPAPATLLRGVRKLEPAGVLDVDLDRFELRTACYWDLPAAGEDAVPRTAGEWEEAVDEQVALSVQRQLVSDVPLGAFLSGGVDSSLVVAHMGEAKTFSIGFDDPSYNEVAWSQRVARHLGVDHTVETIRPSVVHLFDHLMHFMDDPIGDFSIFPTFLVSRLARRDVTVALSGDGGDELFGGYETYVAQQRARSWERLPGLLRRGVVAPAVEALRPRPAKKGLVNKAKRFVEGAEYDPALGHARWRLFVGQALRDALFTPAARAQMPSPAEGHVRALFQRAGPRSEVDRCLYVDLKSYLVDNCLVKVDRMSMACSLEARVPLLDHDLVELAFRVPAALKLRGGETKPLLKRVAARHVPRECIYRPKEGFSIPIKSWLSGEFRPLLEELLAPERLAEEGVFQVGVVERLKREHHEGRANHSHLLWGLLVFQDWRRRWSA